MTTAMSDLWLIYKMAGEEQRIAVTGDLFAVGRHSQMDLAISDARLSREHLRIRRLGVIFMAEDAGSSNGTLLNGEELWQASPLAHGDILSLGGMEVRIETAAGQEQAAAPTSPTNEPSAASGSPAAASVSAASPAAPPASSASSGGSSMMLFIVAPILGVVILGGVLGFLFLRGGTEVAHGSNDNIYAGSGGDEDTDEEPRTNSRTDEKKEVPGGISTGPSAPTGGNTAPASPGGTQPGTGTQPGGSGSGSDGPIDIVKPGKDSSATAKIQYSGTSFLRRIAQNDPKAFMSSEQAGMIAAKVSQFSRSSAIAQNLNSVRKNAGQIKSAAETINVRPQFLAIAAMSRMGNRSGDVMAAVNETAAVFSKMKPHLDSELGDDALLMMAAYDQGANGDILKVRNMLQDLANKFPQSAREIRTIWFLQKNNKISQGEYDAAVNFLAIGVISQNPKDFGVNAEPVQL